MSKEISKANSKAPKPTVKKSNKRAESSSEDDDDYDDEDDEYETASDDEYDDEDEDEDDDDEDDDDDDGEEFECDLSEVGEAVPKKSGEKSNVFVFSVKSKKSKKKASVDENEDESVSSVSSLGDIGCVEAPKYEGSAIDYLMALYESTKNEKLITDTIQSYEVEKQKQKLKDDKKMAKQQAKYARIFKKALRQGNTMNDVEAFSNLTRDEQLHIIKELKAVNAETVLKHPYRITLLQSNIPLRYKTAGLKKISLLRNIEPGSGEYYKCKVWVDGFMKIPFGIYKTLPISLQDGIESTNAFIMEAKATLDSAVFGLDDAKLQILQWLGQLITNPSSVGTAIAIHGPPGTGKTSLIKEGVSKILNRPFAFIPLGGATDSSFLEGHGYTYEGSIYGKIVQILIDSGCMNPIIFFDELDKVSETPKGDEITGVLTHLTDSTQNSGFQDKFFPEVEFDLSKCLFIFSYNDESKVNHILKDRMYRITTKGFNMKQKTSIALDYLIPRIVSQVNFQESDIIFSDDVIQYILNNYCNKEDGVRNLKRCLETVFTKLNLCRLLKPDNSVFKVSFQFPLNVTDVIVDQLLKRDDSSLMHLQMYI